MTKPRERARPTPGRMLVSAAADRWAAIDAEKVARGAYLTRTHAWLAPQVLRFLRAAQPKSIVDPFAGDGDLLRAVAARGLGPVRGFDLDPARGFPVRDSLARIDAPRGAVIVTNPPFLARHSAARKRVLDGVEHWFDGLPHADLYQVALDRCLAAASHVVAIVPETFVHSAFPKHRVASVTVIEDRLFDDTDQPVCVVCFGPESRPPSRRIYYRSRRKLLTQAALDRLLPEPAGRPGIRFNDPAGQIGLRAVDGVGVADRARFVQARELRYDRERIKVSSRLVTLIRVEGLAARRVAGVVARANAALEALRERSHDLVLSPFKGNNHAGVRRRRVDYAAARALLERAVAEGMGDGRAVGAG
ncbi:MAG: hypothetical protein O3C51_17095 [Planctomycetota bacterium]|nr:hypothetical protein [Planctomycetota bacterium]